MKKFAAISFITLLFVGMGGALAQPRTAPDSHELQVTIPDLVMLRITNGPNTTTESLDPSVVFDFVNNEALYMAAIAAGASTSMAPTSAPGFGDIIVLSSRAGWRVNVSAAPFTHTAEISGSPAAGLVIDDILVVPSGATGDGVTRTATGASFPLTTTDAIAEGGRTQGWKELGISGSDYRLTVNGDEAPGTYTTTVTYTITAP